MKISLKNIGKPIVNGFCECNNLGTTVLEIVTENDTEGSLFRGLDEKELCVGIGDEGRCIFIYKKYKKEK